MADRPAPLDRFLRLCCDEISRRAGLATGQRDALAVGARNFDRALATASLLDHELTTVPVAEHLGAIEASAQSTVAICNAASEARPQMPWISTPRLDDGGVTAGLAPLSEVRNLGSLTCGLMLLAPGAAYPEHDHPPHEIYLPIAGEGRWRHGGATDYRPLGADELVYNHPNDRHGAVAGVTPLLALYVLWR